MSHSSTNLLPSPPESNFHRTTKPYHLFTTNSRMNKIQRKYNCHDLGRPQTAWVFNSKYTIMKHAPAWWGINHARLQMRTKSIERNLVKPEIDGFVLFPIPTFLPFVLLPLFSFFARPPVKSPFWSPLVRIYFFLRRSPSRDSLVECKAPCQSHTTSTEQDRSDQIDNQNPFLFLFSLRSSTVHAIGKGK